MSAVLSAQLASVGNILLYVFKASVVFCSTDRKPLRVVVAVCLAFALLASTKTVFKDIHSSLSLSTAGIVAMSAVYILIEAFQPRRPFFQIWVAFLAFGLQQPRRDMKPKPDESSKEMQGKPSPPPRTFKVQLRITLDTFLLASFQYVCYDAAITWVSRYPYSSLIQQPTSFRIFHSTIMGILLYFMFQVFIVPLLAIASLIYPPWAPTGVKTFHRPWLTTSPQDFWSNRWHQFFRTSVLYAAVLPSKHLISSLRLHLKAAGLSPSSPLTPLLHHMERMVPFFSAFILSGLFHEYMNWAALGLVTGHQLAFFVIHGVLVVLEGIVKVTVPGLGAGVPKFVKIAMMYCLLAATSYVFFEPWLKADVQLHFYRPVPVVQPLLTTLGVLH